MRDIGPYQAQRKNGEHRQTNIYPRRFIHCADEIKPQAAVTGVAGIKQ